MTRIGGADSPWYFSVHEMRQWIRNMEFNDVRMRRPWAGFQ